MKREDLKKSPVRFITDGHRYELEGRELVGVTPVVKWLFPETYTDIPDEVLQRAAERGTLVHSLCQLADTMGTVEGDEARAYVELMNGEGLVSIANEYTVSDCENYASQIDVVCADGSLCDIKATSKIHIPNVTLQLSIYAYLFELQNQCDAGRLYVVWLPRKMYGQPCIKELQRISADDCKFILDEYKSGADNTAARARFDALGIIDGDGMPAAIRDTFDEMINLHRQIEALKAREDELKAVWLTAMQEAGEKKTGNDRFTVTRKFASTRATIDSKRLKADYPDIYAKCMKESITNESIIIKFNE